jgi:predicted RNase H-like HicB family nuclease
MLIRSHTPSNLVEYQVVLEYDAETKHYTASVPGLPIVVDAKQKRSAIKLAREAIAIYLEDAGEDARPHVSAEVVTVKV